MLPARYRMTRSTDFGVTVRQGIRAVQPDIVVHALHDGLPDGGDDGPKIGLVVSKSVGSAVQRHRVSRRLRHVAFHLINADASDLGPRARVVIRALPGSRDAISSRLESELRTALKKTRAQKQSRP
ncbi:ribonuclease P protein component [Mycobacterium adipatum]|uniref:Ribonuclease P protein component n=1 Tax=Mycobacterium adipatum TaxID=1682113 RepID=A0A172UGX9_9MYCO|nr:ribonuclease P protein component [Mycobacterium adipatum]ANE78397.1 ribonuclease P protein component [Mycobacterium adipatum]MBI5734711.1 ribonuclease P protein component [Mycolicibacterium neoaurum]